MNTNKNSPKIIAISGPQDYGKTSVIKKICALLKDRCPMDIVNCDTCNNGDEICKTLTVRGANHCSVKIGIKSQGDPNIDIAPCLAEFVQAECKLIICATRTSGGTVNAVRAYDGLPISTADQSNESQRDKHLKTKHMIEWHSPITLQNPNVFDNAVQEKNLANSRAAWNIFKEIQEFILMNGV